MDGGDAPIGPLFPTAFEVIWVGVAVLIGVGFLIVAAGIVTVIVLIVGNIRRARAVGIDPFMANTDLTARLLHADALAPTRSITDRLAELDRLHAAGTITATEHAAARHTILSS